MTDKAKKYLAIAVVAAAAAVVGVQSAHAAEASPDAVQVAIPTDDLQLAQPADQHRLDRRIAAAARDLCATGSRSARMLRMERACRSDVLDSARPQVRMAIAAARAGQPARIALRFDSDAMVARP